MTEPSKLSDLGAGTGGVWTRQEALAVVSPDVVRGKLDAGEWQRLLPGTYIDGGIEPDTVLWGWAVARASGPNAVLSARSAARLWGIPLIDDHDPACDRHEADDHDVAIPQHRGARTWAPAGSTRGGVVHRRQLSLRPADVVRHASGLMLTSPARTLRDLAAQVRRDALVCAIDHALHHGMLSVEELAQEVDRSEGSRQAVVFRWAAEHAHARSESAAETLARLLLLPHLPGLRPQVPVRSPAGDVIARLDLADEELKLAVEADGKRGHAGTQMVAKDRIRDRRTEALGWHTERVTWFELRRAQQAVVRRVVEAARRQRLAA